MKVILCRQDEDEAIEYYVDESKILGHLETIIEENLYKSITLPGGPTIDLSRKSLLNVALRQVFAMAVLPMLIWLADQNQVYIPPKEKHGDVIKYGIDIFFRISRSMFWDIQVTCDDEPYIDGMRTITHASIEKEDSSLSLLTLPSGRDLPNE